MRARGVGRIRRTAAAAFLAAGAVVGVAHARAGQVSQAPSVVYVAPIEGMIDLGLAPFVDRVLREAQTAGAVAVILEINTFGGRVDAAVVIRDALLNSPVPTVAFVNKRAISAGALISLAATHIAMGEGATVGAVTGGREVGFVRAEGVSRDRRGSRPAATHQRGDGRR
jgi:membrane-bound serine protease (ClpP class)